VEALEDQPHPAATQAGAAVLVQGAEVLAKQPNRPPAATEIREDLPEPEGPIMATLSPAETVRSTPRRMFTEPATEGRLSVRAERLSGGEAGWDSVMGLPRAVWAFHARPADLYGEAQP
jgi:hypothetical protein